MKNTFTRALMSLGFILALLAWSAPVEAQTTVTIGTGTVTNTSTSYPAPYGNYWWGARHQMLIPASEIIAAGGAAGNITSLAFDVVSVGGASLSTFEILVKNSSSTAISAWETGLTSVFTSASYTETTGWNTHTFSTPFYWDGTSSLIVEVCFNNGAYTTNAVVNQSTTTYNSTIEYHADATGVCTSTTVSGTYLQRPNIRLVFAPSVALDAGIQSINSPTAPAAPGLQPVTATLRNFGTTTLTSATVNWSVDGVAQAPYAWTGSLASASATSPLPLGSYTFPSGLHTIKAWSSAPNAGVDGFNANDTISVTLNFASPLNGTYTIGGAGANYATVAAAVADINQFGVSGPVTFIVTPNSGPYTGGFDIGAVPGISATNHVTFKGNMNTINESTATYIWGFNGASYITVDSFNIAVSSPTISKFGILIRGASQYITIKNNVVNLGLTNTSSAAAGIVVSGSTTSATSTGNNGKYLTITKNRVIGGYYGITMIGAASYLNCYGNTVSNNKVEDFYLYGIYFSNNDTTTVSGNEVTRGTRTTISTFYGIYATTSRNMKYIGNKVHNSGAGSYSAYPIYITTSANSLGYETELINNAIYNIPSTSTIYGMYILGTNSYINFYFNTVNLTTVAAANTVRGMFFSTAPNNYRLFNNNVSVQGLGTGTKYCIYVTTTAATMVSDFNNFYMSAAGTVNYMGYWSANRAALVDWQTATTQDMMSVSANPSFFAFNDYHCNAIALWNAGTPITGITTDLEGDLRNPTSPCIGADEYMLYNNDAGVTAMTAPLATCAGPATVKATIKNYGITNLASVTVNWSVNNVAQTPFSYTGTLAPSGIDTVTLGSYNFANNTVYNFKFWTSNPNGVADQNTSNDTIVKTGFMTSLNGTYTIGPSPANFQSMADAVSALNNFGVCGPVVFNVAAGSGPYLGGFALNGILGTSATNTITFNGNGNVINETSEQSIVTFNNVSYITFTNFQIINTIPANAKFGIRISGASKYLNITNNTIDVGTVGTSSLSAGIVSTGSSTSATTSGNNGQYLNISNNTIIGGYYGITLLGNSSYLDNYGHTVNNNVVKDFYLYGIYLSNADSSVVSGNNVNRATRSTISTFYGIYAGTSRYIKYWNNRVHSAGAGAYSAYSIYLSTSANSVGYESELVNNAVYNIPTTSTLYGLYFVTVTGVKSYHNSIQLNALSGNTTYGVYYSGAPANCELKNNIFAVEGGSAGTGTKYCIYASSTSATFMSDNNVFHMGATAGTNNIGYWSAARATLLDWQTATMQDMNSSSMNPVFANPAAGNITPLNGGIDNMGTPLGILTDLNNATRSLTTPDVGALEFTGINSDLGITNAKLVAGQCLSTSDSIYVTVSNFIGNAIDFSITPTTVQWSAVGPVNSSGSITLNSGTLAPGSSAVYGAVGVNLSVPGNYSLSTVNLVPNSFNVYAGNDTIKNLGGVTVYNPFYVQPSEVLVYDSTMTVDITAKSKFFPGGAFYFSEICYFKTTAGQPTGGWPTYLLTDDYVEITGVPNSDLGGYVLEAWNASSLINTYTFPTGTLIGPNGTAIIAIGQPGSSVPVPASYYYHANVSFTHSSSNVSGHVLKDGSGNVIDAAGYGNFTFPAISNVTTANWSAPSTSSGTSTSGFRLIGPDNNTGSNWVVTSSTVLQDPNTVNSGTTVPSPTSLTGFNWSLNSQVINNNVVDTTIGPFTTTGQYNYVASYVTPCGTLTDTVHVTVQFLQYSQSDTICEGDTAMLEVWFPGMAPWNAIVTDGSSIDTITGITTYPWVSYVTPSATTTYSILKWSYGGNPWITASNADVTITVLPSPTVTMTAFSSVCSGDAAFALTGGLPAGGTYSGTGVSGGIFDPGTAGAGVFAITYEYTNSSGCSNSAVENITVGASPVASLGPDVTVCEGDSVMLQVSGSGFAADLFFSEYIEGSANNKALEIFNGTGATVNLNNYRINQSTNGGGWQYIHTFPANATLAHGETWVIITNQTDPNLFPAANADEVLAFPSVVHHNGDDARGLEKTTNGGTTWTLIDLIGDPNNDPGTAWAVAGVNNGTAEHTLIRKPTITQGQTNWALSAGTDSLNSEWVVFPQNFYTGLGNHIFQPSFGTGLTYLWSTNDTLPVIIVNPSVTTTYTVTVTSPNNCSTVDTIVVNVNPAPVVAFTSTAANDTICLNHVATIDAGAGYTSYSWSTGATTQSIQVDGNVLGTGTHTFTVSVTDANGCDGTGTYTLYVDPCTGINEYGNNLNVKVYPNPTEGMVNLNIQGLNSSFNLKVTNLHGQIVLNEQIANSSYAYIRTLDLSHLTTGVYFIEVRSGNTLKVEKVVLR